MIPGEILTSAEPVELNPGRQRVVLAVRNTADRPVQVGSHYHFADANPGLSFDRERAQGHRLDIPAGTSVRFEPGVEREVSLVPLAGRRIVPGLRMRSPVSTSGSRSGRVLPNRTSGERDASQPQVRDQTGPSFPNVTNTLNSGEAER